MFKLCSKCKKRPAVVFLSDPNKDHISSTSLFQEYIWLYGNEMIFFLVTNLTFFSLCIQPRVDFYGPRERPRAQRFLMEGLAAPSPCEVAWGQGSSRRASHRPPPSCQVQISPGKAETWRNRDIVGNVIIRGQALLMYPAI